MKKEIDKAKIKESIKNTIHVIIGTFILAMGYEMFLLPAALDTGGVSGISILFVYAGVPVDSELIVTIINVSLFLIGLFILGWKFSAQTLVSTITYPISLYIMKFLVTKWDFLLISNSQSLSGNPGLMVFLSAIFGGVSVGAGCAIAFIGGGSTGGVEIITFILCKYFKRLKSSVSIFVIDAIIVLLGLFINPSHDLALTLEGVFSAFITALVIDRLFVGTSQSFIAYIITDKEEEITKEIIEKMDRTTTIFDSTGGYSKKTKKTVMVSFSMRQYNQLRSIVYNQDKKAFMTISRAHEIAGEGFLPLEGK